MAYLNEDGLARYDGLFKNWVTFKSGMVDGIDALLNWQKTENAASVTFYPLPAAPIDPVVTFAFTETEPAEGDKSSTNPSTITGISTITVTRCETAGVDSTDYTIDLGGTFYGGSVDLSAGVMTVTHFCTNVSTFYQFTEAKTDCILVRFRCDYYSKESSDSVSYVCDLFPSSRDTSDFEHVRQNNDSAISATLYLAKSRLDLSGAADPSSPTDAEWLAAANAWVAEHPFDFVSMLKNPYTVQLTPTQIYSLSQIDSYNPRTNTVYSDQASVQVGYPKSPQATSTELTNAIISLGGNI